MYGAAPGIAASVKPTLELGALAMKSGVDGIIAPGERSTFLPVGGGVHVQFGECLRAIESMLGPRGVCDVCGIAAPAATIGRFCSNVFLQLSISLSSIGVAPPCPRNGALPFLYRQRR